METTTFSTAMWSVGAGAALGSNLIASASVERRLWSGLWVFVAGGGGADVLPGASGQVVGGAGASDLTTTNATLGARLAAGLRLQLADDTAFARPSVVLGAAAGIEQSDFASEGSIQGFEGQDVPTTTTTSTTTTNADLLAGALMDFSLLPWLALRFSTDIVSVGFRSVERSSLRTVSGEQDVETTQRTGGLTGALVLSPAVSLQAFF